jgi:hypothetical protein
VRHHLTVHVFIVIFTTEGGGGGGYTQEFFPIEYCGVFVTRLLDHEKVGISCLRNFCIVVEVFSEVCSIDPQGVVVKVACCPSKIPE